MRPKGTHQELFERRLKAVRLVRDEGLTKTAAGQRVGAHRNAVKIWIDLYEAGGPEALRVQSPPGRPSELDAAQRQDVIDCLLEGPLAHGFATDVWTLPRIAQLIKRRHGVSYDPDHVSRLMRAWGFSWQKPQPRPIERDEPRIARWLAQDWPRIKKKRGVATLT